MIKEINEKIKMYTNKLKEVHKMLQMQRFKKDKLKI